VARPWIRHAGSELDPLGVARGQHELAPDLRRDVLRVGEHQAVEAEILHHAGQPGGPSWLREEEDAELHSVLLAIRAQDVQALSSSGPPTSSEVVPETCCV